MRLKEKFNQLRKEGRRAFIVYVPFGFPNMRLTKHICMALEQAGVDAIELGIPFSDPLADGPIIQKATSLAIEKGADTEKFFKMISSLKGKLKIPVIVMSYYNSIFKFGMDKFFKKMKQLNVNAAIIVDLPLEESRDYKRIAKAYDIDTVFFLTPTTTYSRVKKIVKVSRGFIYYISVTGTTGPKNLDYIWLAKHIKSIKKTANLPVCVGFGIHKAEQVRKLNNISDGVIVGSSIVEFIQKHYRNKNFLKNLKNYIKSLIPAQ